ncbi:MAG: hypothetical protein LBP85_04780 [Prevotellaceae bacterium]|jgi:hypothetical protein|nr:hypothetical protein [Prevotellaceae bacterium]
MKKILFAVILFCSFSTYSQEKDIYKKAYVRINEMLTGKEPVSFINAVFLTEDAYYDGYLNTDVFDDELSALIHVITYISNPELITYEGKDKEVISKHAAIFKVLTDSIFIEIDSANTLIHLPFAYDFEDTWGNIDWTKMFVSKLLATSSGNCHSLPYLYKILADELNVPCYLAFAPNHIYIKIFSQKTGWYNTELTSATFPIDAWLMASGYVSLDAIRNGLYMDTLSNKQAVANCLVDLAQGYQHKYGKENPEFVIKCCNTVLQHHPNNVNAMLTKAEAQKFYIDRQMKIKNAKKPEELFNDNHIKSMYFEMEETYVKLHESGYRHMPEEMYMQWLNLLKTESSKHIIQK